MKSVYQYRNRLQLLAVVLLFSIGSGFAQTENTPKKNADKWGPNDTMIVSAIVYENEIMPYKELGMVWVSNLSAKKLEKYVKEWTRLRNAVYVTYPYAKVAGTTINDINLHLKDVASKKERKDYIQTREKELKKQFSDPLTNLSVYQGKVLMKLINRETGNNCYEILKEYKGGFNARLYQTVAFFVGGNLKQDWDLTDKTDRQIEGFVKEIDQAWYGR
ncbi:MAG TPA: DUF4294 domain-containing protein [Chitinophagaceae bacterium]